MVAVVIKGRHAAISGAHRRVSSAWLLKTSVLLRLCDVRTHLAMVSATEDNLTCCSQLKIAVMHCGACKPCIFCMAIAPLSCMADRRPGLLRSPPPQRAAHRLRIHDLPARERDEEVMEGGSWLI